MQTFHTLSSHQAYSTGRINELIAGIDSRPHLRKNKEHCVFATGAFARSEANSHSSIDWFLIGPGSSTDQKSTGFSVCQLAVGLTQLLDEMNLQGEFVATYNARDLVMHMGTPGDEQHGYWGTRMLFLLESVPIYNSAVYEQLGQSIAVAYIENFHRHTHELPSVFLINDIIRYWKSMCLAYEHQRDFRMATDEHRYYYHKRNLKVIYSKKLACFSFILLLLRHRELHEEGLLEIMRLNPTERLLRLADEQPATKPLVEEVLALFAWFLELYDQPEDNLRCYIEDRDKRNEAFDKGRTVFGQKIFDLVMLVTQQRPEVLKYLLV
ncbi:MAG TPA: hypothetical protein VF690_14505 [Hymenobacter sp.]|jgi:hypothetical protein